MILEHTTHAGYIRQDDVYTDENDVNYTVSQDTDAEDPESAVKHYIENYIPHELPQLETLF